MVGSESLEERFRNGDGKQKTNVKKHTKKQKQNTHQNQNRKEKPTEKFDTGIIFLTWWLFKPVSSSVLKWVQLLVLIYSYTVQLTP